MKEPGRKWRVAGINFDHFHMGDLLRMVREHPQAELVGICDQEPARMRNVARHLRLGTQLVFTDEEECLAKTRPDLVIMCPATARHGEYVERVTARKIHVLIEKPFAASVAEADRMIASARKHHVLLAINWPLRWFAGHCTAYRVLLEGRIGELEEVHYYGGNRGPLFHTAGKVECRPTAAMKRKSWFYREKMGGGSLRDYLGYGATLGTWFHQGRKPLEISTITSQGEGLEVDEHSITIARYGCGLSKFETRWGTFTDPWTHQPQPQCGFVLKGTEGTISSYDYAPTIRVQTRRNRSGLDVPVDVLRPPFQNPVAYFIDRLTRELPLEGPLAPAVSRIGQQIVDSALLSAKLKKNVRLVK